MKSLLIILSFFIPVYQVAAQTRFIWPVKAMPEYGEVSDFYATNNFVDTAGPVVRDYNCGARTYNGHRGIDIDLWPFTWSMMNNNYVAVIAAAPGRVVAAVGNQNNETNCGAGPYANPNWNYIAIRHADSSTSIYGHIRNNSAQVVVGQNVSAGQIIAFVGSSGSSSHPHLHFEVNSTPVTNSQAVGLVDPYAGACNSYNANSWWLNQKPYWEPAIVRVMTHRTRPALTGYNGNNNFCATGEAKNARADFGPNDSIYFGVAMRDYQQNQSFTIAVFDPGGGQWFSETNTNTGAAIPRRYYVFDRRLPGNAASGTYRVVVAFNGTSSVYFFSVNCPATQNVAGAVAGQQGFKASSSITSTASVNAGNRLFLQAGSRITLSPGFAARNGSVLKARIRDCNYSE